MDPNDSNHPETGAGPDGEAAVPPLTPVEPSLAAVTAQCDECGAPVAEEQRYCVVCGAHRRHIHDPAAGYLSRASARSRTTRATSARRSTRGSSRTRGIGVALVLALIPAAAAAGVLAGRSSNNDDASLIHALSRQQAADRVAATGGGSGTVAATTGTGTRSTKPASSHTRKAVSGKSRKGHHRAGGKSNPTSTKATSISTKAPSAAQKATGAKVTQKVQKSTGKSYVNGQAGLPGTVVVP